MKKSTKAKWIILIIVGVFVLLSAGFGIYVSDYYKCDDSVNQYYDKSIWVQIKDIEEGIFIDGPSMAGHSLGGAMAASYCTDNMDKIKGLVLLAAYPTKNLKQNDFMEYRRLMELLI